MSKRMAVLLSVVVVFVTTMSLGAAQTVRLPATASLVASITDDGRYFNRSIGQFFLSLLTTTQIYCSRYRFRDTGNEKCKKPPLNAGLIARFSRNERLAIHC